MKPVDGIISRKSDRILEVITKGSQVAFIDWLHAVLEEQAEPIRRELAELQEASAPGVSDSSAPQHVQQSVRAVMSAIAIEAPQSKRWSSMTDEERAAHLASARFEKKSKAVSGYWARMSPEERTAEMQRRAGVAKVKKFAKEKVDLSRLHPRDPRHPGHEAWLEKMRKASQKRWDGMSAYKRKQLLVSMERGKEAARAQRVNGGTIQ